MTSPSRSNHSCICGSVAVIRLAPPTEATSPYSKMPTIVTCSTPVRVARPTRWPTRRPSSSAVLLMTPTSPGASGCRPAIGSVGSNGSPTVDMTALGANWLRDRARRRRRARRSPTAGRRRARRPARRPPAPPAPRAAAVYRRSRRRTRPSGLTIDVDARVGGLLDVLERRADLVRLDVGAGDHRDAEQDRDGGQGGAQLALGQAAQDERRSSERLQVVEDRRRRSVRPDRRRCGRRPGTAGGRRSRRRPRRA